MTKQLQSVPQTPADPGSTLVLDVRDRFGFGNIFPEQSNLLEMKIIRQIEKKIELSVKELLSIDYAEVLDNNGVTTGRIKWDSKKEKPLSVYLSGIEINLLKKFVNRLSQENKIKREFAELCIKIEEAKVG